MIRVATAALCLSLAASAGADPTVELLWRTELPRHEAGGVAVFGDGTGVAAWTRNDVIVVSRFDARGKLGAEVTLGEPDEVEFEDLAARGDDVFLALRSNKAITIAGQTHRPPPARKNDMFHMPSVGVIVRLDAKGPRQSWTTHSDVEDIRVLPLKDGLFLAASSIGKSDYFGPLQLSKLARDGKPVWSQTHPAAHVHSVSKLKTGYGVSIRANGQLAWWAVSPAGKPIAQHQVRKLPSAGDLGSLEAPVQHGDAVTAFGYTGGPVSVAGKPIAGRPSYSIQPFMLKTPGTGKTATFEDLAVVTGNTAGSGLLGGQPATLMHVIHTGPAKALHRGDYIVLGGASRPRLIPVFQYSYPNDNWQSGVLNVEHGLELYTRDAAFHGREVTLIGHCDRNNRVGCLQRVRVKGL